MTRPKCPRCVGFVPGIVYFKPRGIPLTMLEEVVLSVDELEAVRLADLEGMHHAEAAARMKVSRPTVGRILEEARRKIAEALIKGKAIKIQGGTIMVNQQRQFACSDCQHTWELPHGTGRPPACPACKGRNFRRENPGGPAHGAGRGRCLRIQKHEKSPA